MHLGLAHACDYVAQYSTAAAKKYVILLTDGMPNDQALAVHAADQMRKAGVTLLGIGLGSLRLDQLQEICTPDNAFLLSSWASLAQALSVSPNARSAIVADSEVSISAVQTQVPIRLDSAIPLRVCIRNIGLAPISAGSVLRIGDGRYYDVAVKLLPTTLPTGEEWSFEMALSLNGAPRIEDLPEVVEWTLQDVASKSYFYVTSVGFDVQTGTQLSANCNLMSSEGRV